MKSTRMVFAGVAAATIAALSAAPVLAQDQPPSPSVVWPNGAKKSMVFMYVDTVTAPVGKPAAVCAQTNFFKRGQRVVFRVSAFDKRTGKPLTAKDVKYMYVKIPGLANQGPATFGKHGKDPATAPWFWTLGWTIPSDYPLGVVSFEMVVKTKTGNFGYFTQPPVAAAQLTVVPG